MKSNFYAKVGRLIILAILLILLASVNLLDQTKVLGNEVTYTSGNKQSLCGGLLQPACVPTVENPENALIDDHSYARLLAYPGAVLGVGSYEGIIELKF